MAGNLTDTQRAFIQTYSPLAQDIAAATGLDPSVVLGQVAQETGWGAHVQGNNIFGISPNNQVANYATVQDAGRAYVDLIKARYGSAASARNPDAQARLIASLGYNPSKEYGGYVSQNASVIRAAGQAAALTDRDLDKQLLAEPPQKDNTETITVRPEMSDVDLDRRLLGDAGAANLKPGDVDPITHQPVQFAGPATGPVAASLGKPIQENRNPGPVTQATINLATDPEQRRRIAAAQTFPGMPEKNAESRVFYGDGGRLAAVDGEGNPFYIDPRGVDIDPARGRFDIGNPLAYAGSIAPGVLAAAPGIAAASLAGPGSLAVGPALAGAGAAAGDLGRQYLARWFDPSNSPPPINLLQTGVNAGLATAGQLGGAVVSRIAAPNPLRLSSGEARVMRSEPAMADTSAAYARAQGQGVDLTPGQASGLPSLLHYEDAATTLPSTVDRAADFYRKQGIQLDRAGQNMLSTVSPLTDKSEAARAFQGGAEDAIRLTRQNANAAARPAYRLAESGMQGYTPDLAALEKASPGLQDAMQQGRTIYREFYRSDAPETPDFALWDFTKRALDDSWLKAKRAGDHTLATALDNTRGDLARALDDAYPSYATARATAAPGHALAERLEESGVGSVAGKTGDERARAIVAPVFERNNPQAVTAARGAFEKAGRLDEWNAGVRAYIQDAFDRASMSQQGLNPAMLRRQVWGNTDNREAIRAALTPDQYDGFDNFLHTVENVARTFPMNSLTATRQNARGALLSAAEDGGNVRALDTIATVFSPLRLANIGPTVLSGMRQRMVQSNMQRIVGHLFDPDGLQYLEAMARYKPGTQRAIEATAQVLGRAGNTSLSSPGDDRANTQAANPLAAAR